MAPTHAKSERAIQTHLSPFIDSIIGNVLRFLKQSLYLLQGFLQDTPAGHHHTLNPPAPLTLNRPPIAHWTLAALFRFPASCLFAVFVFCLHFFCLFRALQPLNCRLFALRCFNAIFAQFCFVWFCWALLYSVLLLADPPTPFAPPIRPTVVDFPHFLSSFFLGRKFMLTALHWKCINLCVYTMCRHLLCGCGCVKSRDAGHMCLLRTFYGLAKPETLASPQSMFYLPTVCFI